MKAPLYTAAMTNNADLDIDVLVVDDELDVLDLVGELLGERGLRAHPAKSAKEAKRVLADRPVRIVLSDIRMPAESGLDLMGFVRANYPEVPFYLMTADPGPFYSEIIRSKADGIFIKPFHVERFLDTLSGAVHQRKKIMQTATGSRASLDRRAVQFQG